jgi:hypothetical protein
MSEIENTEVEQTETPTEPAEPIILTFQMSLDNINALLNLLSEQKIKDAMPLFNIIRSQAFEQLQALQKPEDTTVQ